MRVSSLILNLAFMSDSRTLGMVGMWVSNPVPVRVRRTGFCWAFGSSFCTLVTSWSATQRVAALSSRGVGAVLLRSLVGYFLVLSFELF